MSDPLTPGARKWMGKAEGLQALASPDHRAFMEQVKGQLLIVLAKRLGGKVELPLAEVDDTGGWALALAVRDNNIILEAQKKR